jgi:predicted lipoprotein with Yx(FWY)xxD motif
MQMRKTILILAYVVAYVVAFVSCKDDKEEPFQVKVVENATYGKILTDDAGRTLYFFAKGSACEGSCLDNWPLFSKEVTRVKYETSNYVVSDNAFTTVSRGNQGNQGNQTKYEGKPLYYYKEDTQPGDVKGNGVNGNWFVAKPDYSLFNFKAVLVGHNGLSYIPKYDLTPYQSCGGTGEAPCEETLYLTDASGITLYSFKNDRNGTRNYAGSLDVWKPFHVELSTLQVPTGFVKSDFREIVKDNVKQLTYKNWPLYYFKGNSNLTPPVGGDSEAGNTRGVSFPNSGMWPIVNNNTMTAP